MLMLILTREANQKIRIITPSGEIIWVWMKDMERGKCKVLFEADRAVQIDREELLPPDLQFKD